MKKYSLAQRTLRLAVCGVISFLCFPNAAKSATITVTTNLDTVANDGQVTLREAITAINSGSDQSDVNVNRTGTYGVSDTILFNISGSGVHTLQPASALPSLASPVTVDGTSQPGFSGSPLIEIDGSGAGANVDGLHLTAGATTVKGLVINRFSNRGILIDTAGGNVVAGNFIGTDATGASTLDNAHAGIYIDDAADNLIGGAVGVSPGGPCTGDCNLISGNDEDGVHIAGSGSTGNRVQGNFIGTDVTGNLALANGSDEDGLQISYGTDNLIGGTTPQERNVISGNNSEGIFLAGLGTSRNIIQGNFIGTNAAGNAAIPNQFEGVVMQQASDNIIGGSVPGAGNVISGNGDFGISIVVDGATGNVVQGNFIGTQADGVSPLGNFASGVLITAEAPNDNAIGGMVPGDGNVIAFNGGDGISLRFDNANDFSTGNAILGNSIYSNGGLGIDLGAPGVTPNDDGDGDTGPNHLQNFPVLTSAVSANGEVTLMGNLNSTPSSGFRVEFFANDACDDSGNGEGQDFLGSVDLTTDASGNGDISASFNVLLSGASFITATATNLSTLDTSEFSSCLSATILVEDCANAEDDDGDGAVDCSDPDCISNAACVSAPAAPSALSGSGCSLAAKTADGGSMSLFLASALAALGICRVLRRRETKSA